jgi:hypothetical protein
METDGVSGYIDLKTSYDYLNGLRAGKFGILSVFEVDSSTENFRKVLSTETSSGQGLPIRKSSANTYTSVYAGTDPFDIGAIALAEGTIHNFLQIADIGNTSGWVALDGATVGEDTNVSGLVLSQSTLLRLGANAYSEGAFSKAKFGFTCIMNFSAVTTVDAAWSLGLSQAINTAALESNYNPHSIAAAIKAYDANIVFVYYALDESNSGDVSNYYILAYDQDGVQIESEFYGLVSPSGVTGTSLVLGGGYRGRYSGGGRYQGVFRSRIN